MPTVLVTWPTVNAVPKDGKMKLKWKTKIAHTSQPVVTKPCTTADCIRDMFLSWHTSQILRYPEMEELEWKTMKWKTLPQFW